MLRLPPFAYWSPRSLTEAAQMMAAHGPDAMYVAGGTDLYPNMKRRQFEPKHLIGLRRVPELNEFSAEHGRGFRIGAGLTLTQVASHPLIRQVHPALATAAALVSTPQLRNMGTYGGNLCLDTRCNYYNQSYFWRKSIGFCMKKDGDICLVAPGSSRCWAVSSTDTAPGTIALDASVRLVGPQGERVVPARALYRDDGMEYLAKAPDEILTEVIIPPAKGLRSVYLKLRRRGSFDFPILGVAVALRQDGDGTVRHARVVLGGVQSYPMECDDAEKMLLGQRLTPELIDAVAQAAYKPAKPLDNTDMAHGYRKKMSKIYVERALRTFLTQ
ncbi:MAG: FAD binding domain-containing protein [Chloroflexi bacterium]|nr:FAD binding domain-containing protein [Chloroflexota bacterium]